MPLLKTDIINILYAHVQDPLSLFLSLIHTHSYTHTNHTMYIMLDPVELPSKCNDHLMFTAPDQ